MHPRSPGFLLHWRQRMVYWAWSCPRWQVVAGLNSGPPNCWAAAVVQRLMTPRRYLDLAVVQDFAPPRSQLMAVGPQMMSPTHRFASNCQDFGLPSRQLAVARDFELPRDWLMLVVETMVSPILPAVAGAPQAVSPILPAVVEQKRPSRVVVAAPMHYLKDYP